MKFFNSVPLCVANSIHVSKVTDIPGRKFRKMEAPIGVALSNRVTQVTSPVADHVFLPVKFAGEKIRQGVHKKALVTNGMLKKKLLPTQTHLPVHAVPSITITKVHYEQSTERDEARISIPNPPLSRIG